ncbi:sulfate ABC transporter permease subunit CysT [Clostridium tyrobutyricum]|jgi:sulfate transport system permease protein|uniref:Sulfate transport system permease protein CysT n=1 Tax=Clostridium tyrobutyricum DIVETGP TaxID=1408889 RepID=W6N5D5_CLOTY|nr:sulfate ABC transporter permease subunit CysT [Clostridium tyrobutyricum]AND84850.1 sulfate transport system permease protein [Clostridium tyrobutyricum]ANP69431.1 sulfate ABC transporter permease subunit CysT [Clostridium tyrobutyricum]MBV4434244.1 sulfate ABC transporter permease subunit CysT [Clostridium tyrobutyricum]MBV4449370.1 sulfate ABC transporter permease subunit CysT [Clostridium tyrobutyricum]MCH4199181.1 sulfate ABC transporter permease subunit CysT [Clostridium tyrobutyricum]
MVKKTRVIPGFNISMGLAILYLSLIVLIPLSTIFIQTSKMGIEVFLKTITDPRVVASYKISFGCAFIAAAINAAFGLIIAWVLVRYDFHFKRFLDGCIDLPFALPTAVAGISLTTLYSKNGWIGSILAKFGIQGSFSTFGITVALVFIGIPFVVRTIQPVLEDLDVSIEEAASVLGASRIQIFIKVILPQLIAPLLTGFSLAFARGIGEYGSVVFIAGNKPMKTEIAPLLIMTKLEQFDYSSATAIALVMLVFSFLMLFVINLIQWKANKYA